VPAFLDDVASSNLQCCELLRAGRVRLVVVADEPSGGSGTVDLLVGSRVAVVLRTPVQNPLAVVGPVQPLVLPVTARGAGDIVAPIPLSALLKLLRPVLVEPAARSVGECNTVYQSSPFDSCDKYQQWRFGLPHSFVAVTSMRVRFANIG